MANSVDPDQTAPIGAVCSESTLFASILNLSVMLGNYLQQTTPADDIFRCIFSGALRVKRLLQVLPKTKLSSRERSGSVVECLTRDREVAGSSLTGVAALCPRARLINPCLVLVQPRKTHPDITQKLLTGK